MEQLDKKTYAKIDLVGLKKQSLRLQESITSIRDRIKNIEWCIEMDIDIEPEQLAKFMNERQSAIDKLRHVREELLLVEEKIIEAEGELNK